MLIFYGLWKGNSLTGNALSKDVLKILFLWILSDNIALVLPTKLSVSIDKSVILYLLILFKPSLLNKLKIFF